MDKLILTYNQVDVAIKDLADSIFSRKSKISTIVAITRGGMYPALKLSQLLGIKDIRTISLESYSNQNQEDLKELFCADIDDSPTTLFVDDLWDSGKTITYIKNKFPNSKTAVIYYKSDDPESDSFELYNDNIDFIGKVIEKTSWVVFPWEEEKTLFEIQEEKALEKADFGIENFTDKERLSYQGFMLSNEQLSIIHQIENGGELILLTGKAGAGKSTIIKELLHRNPTWAVCATTGRSALLIGGCTVDKLFAYDRANDRHFDEYLLAANMNSCGNTIIIDEASMAGKKMFEACYTACIRYGKRLVLVGDWGQASPIKDDWIFKSRVFLEDAVKLKLTETHRQNSGEFLEVLDKIRNGIVDNQVNEMLSSRVYDLNETTHDDKLFIFHTNDDVNGWNREKVHLFAEKNNKEIFQLNAYAKDIAPNLKEPEKKIKFNIESSCFAYEEDLCLGCKVLITRNNSKEGYVNGDTGILVSKSDGHLKVRLDRNNHNVEIGKETLEIKDAQDRLEMKIVGFPIRCGYAFTVHKCQGLTIPKVFVYINGITHSREKHGLCYVALSRVRNLEDLYLSSWDPNAVLCSDIVKPYL